MLLNETSQIPGIPTTLIFTKTTPKTARILVGKISSPQNTPTKNPDHLFDVRVSIVSCTITSIGSDLFQPVR